MISFFPLRSPEGAARGAERGIGVPVPVFKDKNRLRVAPTLHRTPEGSNPNKSDMYLKCPNPGGVESLSSHLKEAF
jgi:hypothetical protein